MARAHEWSAPALTTVKLGAAVPTSRDDADTLALIARLDAELTELAGNPCENHFTLHADEVQGTNGRMVRARYDNVLVGCGAVRTIAPGVGELKRMYVDESVRGNKIGAALVDHLEGVALELGLRELKLETSDRQPAAVGLYERFGFEPCEPWGEYIATAATSLSSVRPQMVTWAPSCTRRMAQPRPMPLPPPVTTTNLPWKVLDCLFIRSLTR